MNISQTKAIRLFADSAAALLLALASALFLINLTGPLHLVQPHDPFSTLSLRYLFWIIGGIAALTALFCLFTDRPARTVPWVAWLVTNLLVYRIGLYWYGCHNLAGFLGGFSYAFGISAQTANALANGVFVYLFAGSYASLIWLWLGKSGTEQDISSLPQGQPKPAESLKMFCPSCGGKIKFSSQNLGRKIPCPLCRAALTLRAPENLKMSCSFCKEHIEFPAHAVGQKIPCPHCNMGITLKEPA